MHNDFIVWSFAAGGGKSTSVAGSAAVQITLLTTEASIGAGAEIDAPAGGITVDAAQPMRLQNLAIAGALSTGDGAAIGGAFVVNYLEVNTRAWIDSTGGNETKVDASRRDRGHSHGVARLARAQGARSPSPARSTSPSSRTSRSRVRRAPAAPRWSARSSSTSSTSPPGPGSPTARRSTRRASAAAGQNVTVAAPTRSRSTTSAALSPSARARRASASPWSSRSRTPTYAPGSETAPSVRAGGFVKVEGRLGLRTGSSWRSPARQREESPPRPAPCSSSCRTRAVRTRRCSRRSATRSSTRCGRHSPRRRRPTKADLASGNLAISTSGAGVGASVTVVVRDSVVTARIADGADVRALGDLTVEALQTGDYLAARSRRRSR